MPEEQEPEAPEQPVWMQQIEDAIVEKLRSALTPLPVAALTDKPNFIHKQGDALVMLVGMRPKNKNSQALNTSLQEITLTYEVYLRSRSLRNHTGLYPMLNASMQALIGFRPGAAQHLTLANSAFDNHEDGVWSWVLSLETDTWLVPCLETADGPLFDSATFSNCCDCEDCDCEEEEI